MFVQELVTWSGCPPRRRIRMRRRMGRWGGYESALAAHPQTRPPPHLSTWMVQPRGEPTVVLRFDICLLCCVNCLCRWLLRAI